MRGIRFVVGRLRYSTERAVQSVVFDSHEWSERDARDWLDRHGFKVRALDRDGRWWRSRQREPREFEPRSFKTVETGRREMVTMASNPKRRGKKRRAHKRRRPAAARRRKLSARSRRRTPVQVNARSRRAKAKTVRTKVTTVRVMRSNSRRARSSRAAARYTLAFAPAAALQFARIARLSKVRRREMRRALRRHPSGGVYVALPTWHGTREQAQRLAARVQLILAYAAGRRRAALTSSAAPRVVAVP